MKCPKCQYIGFDQGHRCRNCGYDFSLSADAAELDLPIKTGDEPLGPLADFTLTERSGASAPELVRSAAASHRESELPLFGDRLPEDDTPLVSLPASPRAPVSVRKSAAIRHVPRPPADEPSLDLDPETAPVVPVRRPVVHDAEPRDAAPPRPPAPAGPRLLGAVVDLLLIASIDVTVVYLTLQLCELRFVDLPTLPIAPLAAFLAMLNGGYMAAFTAAGGQSIGKMVAGTRVVGADDSVGGLGVPLGQAIVRAAAYGVSVLPLGLGFLPALIGAERRAIHDRLAHTRVVRA